jgi:hypothetical protein
VRLAEVVDCRTLCKQPTKLVWCDYRELTDKVYSGASHTTTTHKMIVDTATKAKSEEIIELPNV